jgi:hypothetical protein
VKAETITGKRKTLWNGKMVGAFAFGTRKLYNFLHQNPAVEIHRGRVTNDPYILSQNHKMVSINTAIQLDLSGQVVSESIGPTQFSGTGGQFETAMGAQRSPGGKSIGTTVTVNTLGLDWGFFASNTNFTGTRTCGATTNTTCSDATGGFVAQPFQQHALFINAAGDQFLVGLEDNLLGLWSGDNPVTNPTNQDSDYQDYIFNVVPHVIPSGGCTFTKGWYRNHGSNTVTAVDGRTKAQAQAIFAATPGQPGGVTWQGGNDVLNLYQQLLAAILNGGTSGPAATQAAIAAAQAGTGGTGLNITTTLTQTQVSDLIDALTAFNEGTLPGFPHCS